MLWVFGRDSTDTSASASQGFHTASVGSSPKIAGLTKLGALLEGAGGICEPLRHRSGDKARAGGNRQ